VTTSISERDELIGSLRDLGWSQRAIARHEGVNMTQAGVSHALTRLAGKTRKRASWDGPHPTGNPANARDPSKVISCAGCTRLVWRGTKKEPYFCAECRASAT